MPDARSEIEAVFNEMTAAESSQDSSTQEAVSTESESQETPAAPATQEATSATTETTTEQETPSPSSTPQKRGPIPLDRHEEVLRNTRREYEEKLTKLSWAEKYKPEDIETKLSLAEMVDQNPIEFFRRFYQAASTDPVLFNQMRAVLGASQEQKAKVEEDPMPAPDRLLDSGDLVYSHQQQVKLLDWKERQMERKFEERYGKVAQKYEQDETWNKELSRQAAILKDARETWDGFKDHEAEIRAVMAQDGRTTLESAYRRVVVPKLKANEEQLKKNIRAQLLAELNNKGEASTVEKPGSTVPAPPKTFTGMSTEDILRETYRELEGRA